MMIKSKILFVREFIKNPKSVGAIWTSSRYLAKKISNRINYENANCIVEYGAGTGSFTLEIIAHLSPNAHLIIFENNAKFYSDLFDKIPHDQRDKSSANYNPYVHLIQDSVENVCKHVHHYGFNTVEYVVSGLPFASFPNELSRHILQNTLKILGDKGIFLAFQYSRQRSHLFRECFKKVRAFYEWRNIPPAFVYECRNF